jgi:hypothetical protein
LVTIGPTTDRPATTPIVATSTTNVPGRRGARHDALLTNVDCRLRQLPVKDVRGSAHRGLDGFPTRGTRF